MKETNTIRNFKNKIFEEGTRLQIAKSIIFKQVRKMHLLLVIIMFLSIGCDRKEETTVRNIPTGMKATKLSDILENPARYDNKKVLLEGVVGGGCLACPSHFPYQEGANSIQIFVKDFKRPNLKQAQPIRIYAEVKAIEERVVIYALALEVR